MAGAGIDMSSYFDKIKAAEGTFGGLINPIIEDYKKSLAATQNQKGKDLIEKYVKNKEYLDTIPVAYRCLSESGYEKKLDDYLQRANGRERLLNKERCDKATQSFVSENKAFFEELLESHIKKNAVANLRIKIRKRTKTVPKQYLPIYNYKRNPEEKACAYAMDLERLCITPEVEVELQELAWKNRWGQEIPDSVVDKYYKRAEKEFKKQAPKDQIDTSALWPTWPQKLLGKIKKQVVL
jgi:hypothetical protein